MIYSIFIKSIKEQLRNLWILILTVSLAPFFVFVYYLINESSQPSYEIMIFEQNQNITVPSMAEEMVTFFEQSQPGDASIPLSFQIIDSREAGIKKLKDHHGDALVVLPVDLQSLLTDPQKQPPVFEIIGDLTRTNYLIAAVWVGELMNDYYSWKTSDPRAFLVKETALGSSGETSEFEMWMPGMLVLSIIMLMFSATIAFITEVDQGTILRLKLSRMKAGHFLAGVGLSQIIIGLLSILLTLMAAVSLGFQIRGSWSGFVFVAILTSVSMIAFSLLLAAFTRTVTDVLIVGNFPLFLFMFFTGAAFPMRAKAWFYIADYPVSWQSFMSPVHGISALNKVSIMGSGFGDIVPEIIALTLVSLLYLLLGLWAFNVRHLKTT